MDRLLIYSSSYGESLKTVLKVDFALSPEEQAIALCAALSRVGWHVSGNYGNNKGKVRVWK
jgi:hypothetical protein